MTIAAFLAALASSAFFLVQWWLGGGVPVPRNLPVVEKIEVQSLAKCPLCWHLPQTTPLAGVFGCGGLLSLGV